MDTPKQNHSKGNVSTEPESIAQELKQRFDTFRSEQPPRTKIPKTLRDAALVAIRSGVIPATIRRLCKISSTQLKTWQRQTDITLQKQATSRAQIFSVLDEEMVSADTVSKPQAEYTPPSAPSSLELRLGQWSISVSHHSNREH